MFATPEFERRLASLRRAEADRTGVPSRAPFAKVAMARRYAARLAEPVNAVDPVAASIPDAQPMLLRS